MTLQPNYPNKRVKLELETYRQLIEFIDQSLIKVNDYGDGKDDCKSNIGKLINLEATSCSNWINEPLLSLNCDIENFIWNFSSKFRDDLNLMKFEEIQLKCESIIDWCWQLINCGKWSEVSIELRKFYSYHQLLNAILLLLMSSNSKSSKESSNESSMATKTLIDALQSVDQGLIMSPDFHGSLLTKSASLLHRTIVKQLKQQNCLPQCPIVQQWNRIQQKLLERSTNLVPKEMVINRPINFGSSSNFGHQNIPRIELLDFFEFQQNYLHTKTPIIITGAIEEWPCRSSRKWTLNYLLERAGYRRVPIEIGSKYTDDEWSQRVMSLIDFMEQFILVPTEEEESRESSNKIGYLAQHNLFEQITELAEDFSIPDYCGATEMIEDSCSEDSSSSAEVDINGWFGPSGTVSPLHTDPKHNLFVQVFGQKYIRLYSDIVPASQIYPHEDSHLLANTSKIDLKSVDFERYPEFNHIDPSLIHECILSEGEILFIPKLFWHYVESLSTSFSISFWW